MIVDYSFLSIAFPNIHTYIRIYIHIYIYVYILKRERGLI